MKNKKLSQKINEQAEKASIMNIKIDKIVESIHNHIERLGSIKEKKTSKS